MFWLPCITRCVDALWQVGELQALHADEIIVSTEEDIVERVKQITGDSSPCAHALVLILLTARWVVIELRIDAGLVCLQSPASFTRLI